MKMGSPGLRRIAWRVAGGLSLSFGLADGWAVWAASQSLDGGGQIGRQLAMSAVWIAVGLAFLWRAGRSRALTCSRGTPT